MSEIALGEVTLKVRPEGGESQNSQWKNIPGRGNSWPRSSECSRNRSETRVAKSSELYKMGLDIICRSHFRFGFFFSSLYSN